MSVHSSFQNCYASRRSISLAVLIAPSSALITSSLTPSVIGDRPSHPVYGLISSVVSAKTSSCLPFGVVETNRSTQASLGWGFKPGD
jgi:hypothetical protein